MSSESLTLADMKAIDLGNGGYINNKGAKFYAEGKYKEAIMYYNLAASMGVRESISNLGYCYLYGREVEADTTLALAYFNLASQRGDVEATYKLGDIYSTDKWGLENKELSIYYYKQAISLVIDGDDVIESIIYNRELEEYPSLCFALGREHAQGQWILKDLSLSYIFLIHAQRGYEEKIRNGQNMYKNDLEKVNELLEDNIYDIEREKYPDFPFGVEPLYLT